jgi:hypothetical protein
MNRGRSPECLQESGRSAAAAQAGEFLPITRQVSRMNERSQDSLTPARLNTEQPGGLRQRERESWHFVELRLNPRAQIMFLAVFAKLDMCALL